MKFLAALRALTESPSVATDSLRSTVEAAGLTDIRSNGLAVTGISPTGAVMTFSPEGGDVEVTTKTRAGIRNLGAYSLWDLEGLIANHGVN